MGDARSIPACRQLAESLPRAVAVVLLALAAATAASAQTMTATWDRNTDPHTVGYRIYGGERSGEYPWSADVGDSTSAVIPELSPGRSYHFVIRAYNGAGIEGPASAEVVVDTGMPAAPTNVAVTTRGPQVTLTWDPPVDGPNVSRYLVSVGTSPGSSNVVQAASVGPRLSVGGELSPGRYYARVHAANGAGLSPPSDEVAFVVAAPDQPGSPSALAASWNGTVVTLHWTAGVGAAAYVIEAGSSSGLADLASVRVGNVTSYSVDVPPGTYYVRVRSANAGGMSGPSNEVVLQGHGAPDPPAALAATDAGPSVELRWAAPAGGAAPTGYVIEVGSAPGLANLARVRVGTVTGYAATARPGTYYVRVRAVNARGSSAPSNEIALRR